MKPLLLKYSLSSKILNFLKWKSEAARTASALPYLNASLKCSNFPAPPLAITGISTLSEIFFNSSLSYPDCCPS